MTTNIYLFIETVTFLGIILVYYRLSKRMTSKQFIGLTLGFILIMLIVPEGFNILQRRLNNRGIPIELGHASLLNLMIWFPAILVAAILITVLSVQRIRHR